LTKNTRDKPKPPECWLEKQPEKPRKKLYGIWARYNISTKEKIEKECSHTGGKKRKGVEKKRKGK